MDMMLMVILEKILIYYENNLQDLQIIQEYTVTGIIGTFWMLQLEIITSGMIIIQIHIHKYMDMLHVGLYRRVWALGHQRGLGDM